MHHDFAEFGIVRRDIGIVVPSLDQAFDDAGSLGLAIAGFRQDLGQRQTP